VTRDKQIAPYKALENHQDLIDDKRREESAADWLPSKTEHQRPYGQDDLIEEQGQCKCGVKARMHA
jgi:hypothetical protein